MAYKEPKEKKPRRKDHVTLLEFLLAEEWERSLVDCRLGTLENTTLVRQLFFLFWFIVSLQSASGFLDAVDRNARFVGESNLRCVIFLIGVLFLVAIVALLAVVHASNITKKEVVAGSPLPAVATPKNILESAIHKFSYTLWASKYAVFNAISVAYQLAIALSRTTVVVGGLKPDNENEDTPDRRKKMANIISDVSFFQFFLQDLRPGSK